MSSRSWIPSGLGSEYGRIHKEGVSFGRMFSYHLVFISLTIYPHYLLCLVHCVIYSQELNHPLHSACQLFPLPAPPPANTYASASTSATNTVTGPRNVALAGRSRRSGRGWRPPRPRGLVALVDAVLAVDQGRSGEARGFTFNT
jgi:hypothetical protein